MSQQIDVNDPGDLIFLNSVHNGKQPTKCAGWDEARIEIVPWRYKCGTEAEYYRIHCPATCPRDPESTKRRCGIEF